MSRHVERNAKALQKVLGQKQESNEEIELKDMMSRLTMDTIASTGFGLDIDTLNNPDNEFSKNAKEFINPNVVLMLISYIVPFLGKMLDTVGIKFISQRATDFFEKVVDTAIQERKESGNAGKMHDFLDLVINAEESDEGGKVHGSLTREEILVSYVIVVLGEDKGAFEKSTCRFVVLTIDIICLLYSLRTVETAGEMVVVHVDRHSTYIPYQNNIFLPFKF